MFICLCQGVTDRQIQSAVAEGAASLRDLRLRLGIARDCGACAADALKCLRAAREAQSIGGCPGSCESLSSDAVAGSVTHAAA